MRISPQPSGNFTGFTLIELLVSISIIILLATLLIVTAGKVIDSASIAQCSANLRAIGAASAGYIADNNGEFFPKKHNSIFNFIGKTVSGRPSALERPLNAYLGVTNIDDPVKVALCNTRKGKNAHQTWGTSYNSNHSEDIGSLSLRSSTGSHVPYSAEDPMTQRSIRLSAVQSPSRFIIAMEHGAADAVGASDGFLATLRSHWPNKRRFHLLFADGHVAAVDIVKGKKTTETYTFSHNE
ncbi:MAG: type II secretion system protein [Chthoniobacterales bacterium]